MLKGLVSWVELVVCLPEGGSWEAGMASILDTLFFSVSVDSDFLKILRGHSDKTAETGFCQFWRY